jgi:predicted dehydrogenase
LYARNLAVGGSIRAAIVGAGYIADFHARAIKAAHGVELAAVCDVNSTAVEAFAKSWGVPA